MTTCEIFFFSNLSSRQQYILNDIKNSVNKSRNLSEERKPPEQKNSIQFGTKVGTITQYSVLHLLTQRIDNKRLRHTIMATFTQIKFHWDRNRSQLYQNYSGGKFLASFRTKNEVEQWAVMKLVFVKEFVKVTQIVSLFKFYASIMVFCLTAKKKRNFLANIQHGTMSDHK